MFENKKEVKTYMVEMLCPCGGVYEYTQGFALATFPPQYPHKCNICGQTKTFNCVYPKIEYEIAEEN